MSEVKLQPNEYVAVCNRKWNSRTGKPDKEYVTVQISLEDVAWEAYDTQQRSVGQRHPRIKHERAHVRLVRLPTAYLGHDLGDIRLIPNGDQEYLRDLDENIEELKAKIHSVEQAKKNYIKEHFFEYDLAQVDNFPKVYRRAELEKWKTEGGMSSVSEKTAESERKMLQAVSSIVNEAFSKEMSK